MTTIIEKYSVVIIESRPDLIIVRCGYCDGNGCDYCRHTGYRKLLVPKDWDCDYGVYKCGYCNGNGCDYCGHIGAFVGASPRLICGYCDGNGCDYCHHHGSVWVGKIP